MHSRQKFKHRVKAEERAVVFLQQHPRTSSRVHHVQNVSLTGCTYSVHGQHCKRLLHLNACAQRSHIQPAAKGAIYSKTPQQHLLHLRAVLQTLKNAQFMSAYMLILLQACLLTFCSDEPNACSCASQM